MDQSQRNVLFAELHHDGYERYAPSLDAAKIDGAVCAKSKCENCGHQGMGYRPFSQPGSYRAFACCPECGHAHEF